MGQKKNAAKEYLKRIALLDAQIEQKLDAIESLRETITRTTQVMRDDTVSGGGYQDKISGAVAKLVDMTGEMDKEIDRLTDLKKQAYGMINRMKVPRHVTLLHDRYFLRMSFAEIAEKMGYTERGVCYLHGRALQEFEQVMDESKNEKV